MSPFYHVYTLRIVTKFGYYMDVTVTLPITIRLVLGELQGSALPTQLQLETRECRLQVRHKSDVYSTTVSAATMISSTYP